MCECVNFLTDQYHCWFCRHFQGLTGELVSHAEGLRGRRTSGFCYVRQSSRPKMWCSACIILPRLKLAAPMCEWAARFLEHDSIHPIMPILHSRSPPPTIQQLLRYQWGLEETRAVSVLARMPLTMPPLNLKTCPWPVDGCGLFSCWSLFAESGVYNSLYLHWPRLDFFKADTRWEEQMLSWLQSKWKKTFFFFFKLLWPWKWLEVTRTGVNMQSLRVIILQNLKMWVKQHPRKFQHLGVHWRLEYVSYLPSVNAQVTESDLFALT